MRPSSNDRGFTLIELMMVVVVVGVIMALAVPSLRGAVQGSRVKSAASTLYAAFVEAQGLAKSKGHSVCLVLDKTNRKWSMQEDTNLDLTCDSTIKSQVLDDNAGISYLTSGFGQTFPAPFDNTTSFPVTSWCTVCSSTPSTLRFEPDGTIHADVDAVGGSVAIYDASALTGRIFGLVFVTRTGSVHLYERQ